MSDSILKIRNLNVEFPLFGGILQREVACVKAIKDLTINIKKTINPHITISINFIPPDSCCGGIERLYPK